MAALHFLSPLLLTVTLSPLASANSCPEDPGWWAAGPSCYLMSQGPLSWQEAREVSHHVAVHCHLPPAVLHEPGRPPGGGHLSGGGGAH